MTTVAASSTDSDAGASATSVQRLAAMSSLSVDERLSRIEAQLATLVRFTDDIRSLAESAPKLPFLPDFSRVARKD